MTEISGICCQVCSSPALTEVAGIPALSRITSDSQPFPAGGNLFVCDDCGTIQTLPTQQWLDDIANIYANYKIYNLSKGIEQGVLDAGGQVRRRSSVLVSRLADAAGLKPAGRMLDIGCGNGAMLASFAAGLPGWELYGLELDDKYKDVVESIPGVKKLLVGALDVAEGPFDVITMLHALEHFNDPVAFLKQVRTKLSPGGHLFIEVPNTAANPFDFLVADHCCHFTRSTLEAVVQRAGFDVVVAAEDWVQKELSLVARPGAGAQTHLSTTDPAQSMALCKKNVSWLESVSDSARTLAARDLFGVFGTSLAATWIFGEVGGKVSFFVDEDVSRHGTYFDRPVVDVSKIPQGAGIFLPFPPAVAASISARIGGRGFSLHPPPTLD